MLSFLKMYSFRSTGEMLAAHASRGTEFDSQHPHPAEAINMSDCCDLAIKKRKCICVCARVHMHARTHAGTGESSRVAGG